ncbi:glycosyltransferase [Flavobacterium sp. NRK F10]|uniref:Glycosyl transferase family 2 n=1 Tax=Flavobacterium sediminis TaxID=2201181 RepID=A0A2U8QS02_9FLAO|nr:MULTISPECIES: glycosyltransferase [Flavobacterium]AWM12625.1 glycosyl transferase family 2 [Flavobacterium sediminis]MCO6173743.1 glycosyltransferase [Flavobacterium sp. NRK F10]
MLSILIPTYEYNVLPLVRELKNQADTLGFDYEIIVGDDSRNTSADNEEITHLSHCRYIKNKKNLGRGQNINFLVEQSQYNWILIQEADAMPQQKNYIKNWVTILKETNKDAIFGGVLYPEEPFAENKLRWLYGTKTEVKKLEFRKKNPYQFVFTWNLALKKEIFQTIRFPEYITEYGYEDVVFLKLLKQENVLVEHFKNPLIHLNVETNSVFIKKTEKAIENLYFLICNQRLEYTDTKLGTSYQFLKKFGFLNFFKFLFKQFEKSIRNNLISKKPNLNLFFLYKLGYFCTISPKQNV